jgi:outer membrane phospholipase A
VVFGLAVCVTLTSARAWAAPESATAAPTAAVAPTTVAPESVASTTVAPATVAPGTVASTTVAPTSSGSPAATEGLVRAPGAPPRTAVPERVGGDPSQQYFFLHDDNFFSLQANGGWPPRVKFQVSVRFEMVSLRETDNVAVNFAYTQKAFWDLFAFDRSSPFVENDYRPELFLSLRPHREQRYREFQLGVQHESNGLGNDGAVDQTPDSRSWNYVFGEARWGLTRAKSPGDTWFYLTPGIRAWVPFGVSNDLTRYEGYLKIFLDVDFRIPEHPNWGRFSARLTAREHNLQADVFYPIFSKVRCWLFGQVFYGEAERLITAPDSVTHVYAGIGFQ